MRNTRQQNAVASSPWNRLSAGLEELQALEFESAPAYLQAAEALAEEARQPGVPALLRIKVLAELGNALRTAGRLTAAISGLNAAISEAEQLPPGRENDEVLALSHLRAAIASDVSGSIVQGFHHIDSATGFYRAMEDRAGLARCDMVRAALYLRLEDFEESEASYRRALAHYRSTGENERIAVALTNLSTVLRHQNRTEEAVAVGRESLEFATSSLLRTTAKGNLASALGDAGLLDEALEMHRSTEARIKEIGHPNYVITYRRSVATILALKGEYAEAIGLLKEALSEASKLGLERDITECHGLLAQVYAGSGDYEPAYNHQEQYHRLKQEQHRIRAANQLEFHKWQLRVEAAESQAEEERLRRKRLADSFDEIRNVNQQLSARAAELEWSSYRDSLTELANRRYFDQRLGDLTARGREEDAGLAILLLDIDRFKDINDRFGHLRGDEVLRATAQILRTSTRRSDLPARIGGEEFAVLLTGITELEVLHKVADKVRRAFEDYDWDEITAGISVSVSIGAARLSEVGRNPLKLLGLADQRLYAAKRAGRNRVVSEGHEADASRA